MRWLLIPLLALSMFGPNSLAAFQGELLSYNQLRALPPAKRVQYVKDVRNLLIELERLQNNKDYAGNEYQREDLQEQIATLWQFFALLPEAYADTVDSADPTGLCTVKDTIYNADVGTCVRINPRATSGGYAVPSQYFGHAAGVGAACPDVLNDVSVPIRGVLGTTVSYCIPLKNANKLGPARLGALQRATPKYYPPRIEAADTRSVANTADVTTQSPAAPAKIAPPPAAPPAKITQLPAAPPAKITAPTGTISGSTAAIVPQTLTPPGAQPAGATKPVTTLPVSSTTVQPAAAKDDGPETGTATGIPTSAASGSMFDYAKDCSGDVPADKKAMCDQAYKNLTYGLDQGKTASPSAPKGCVPQKLACTDDPNADRTSAPNLCVSGGFFSTYRTAAKAKGQCNIVRKVPNFTPGKGSGVATCGPTQALCNPALFCVSRSVKGDTSGTTDPLSKCVPFGGTSDTKVTERCEQWYDQILASITKAKADGKETGYTDKASGKSYTIAKCDPADDKHFNNDAFRSAWDGVVKSMKDNYSQCLNDGAFRSLNCSECQVIAKHISEMNVKAAGSACASDAPGGAKTPSDDGGAGKSESSS